MVEYKITGMNCSACSSKIQKKVSNIDGVKECSVNLLTNSMTIDGDVNPTVVISTVKRLGYGISLKDKKANVNNESEEKAQIRKIKNRLFISLGFLVLLSYIAMGVIMWNFPFPAFLKNNLLIIGLIELLLALIIMIINNHFFINGIKGIIRLSPNMDSLVSLGSLASFIYSAVYLFVNVNSLSIAVLKNLYFEAAGMILVLVTIGKLLEAFSKGKTTNALEKLKNLAPKTATIVKDGIEQIVDVLAVKEGDIIVVKAGESIPVDGVVLSGVSAVNEASLTGESMPVDKNVGDKVYTSTINLNGVLYIKTLKVGEQTALSKIIEMVEKASTGKAPVAKIADTVSGIFVPIVLVLGVIATIVWLSAGSSLGFALARGISVLVISCPCALGLATPVAIMVGNGLGARRGILFKSAEILENAGKIKIVAFDKTGTITNGEMSVTDIIPTEFFTQNELLEFAYSLENNSLHPIAKAIVNKAVESNAHLEQTTNFTEIAGKGIFAKINGVTYFAGKLDFIAEKIQVDDTTRDTIIKLNSQGKTSLLLSTESDLLGIIALSDTIKKNSKNAIIKLKKMGIIPVMLTGDNADTAQNIAKSVGIDRVYANLLPDQKGDIIKSLKEEGAVAMVGDGINDALALTLADVGIAIGAGTDIAIDCADVILMNSNLLDVTKSITLSKKTLRVIKQNLFWAFIYNVIGIPLASGVFIPLLSWQLNPMFASACMSVSSLFVVTNALRLNLMSLDEKVKESKQITATLSVSGMMCEHCVKSVKDGLSKISGVVNATADFKTGIVTVTFLDTISLSVITATIESLGYKVNEQIK